MSTAGGNRNEHLRACADALSLGMTPVQQDQLLRYVELLQRWNGVYNLTSIRDPSQMLSHHVVDCLAVLPPLSRHLGGRQAKVLDVGSGGGLPGVVLAIMCSHLTVTCVDTVGKKAAFITQAAAELGLSNLSAVHRRVEQMEGQFDLITSRAFASLSDFCSLTQGRLASDGVWLALKGKIPVEEMAVLPSAMEVFHVEQLIVPGLDAQRCLVWMRSTQVEPPKAAPV